MKTVLTLNLDRTWNASAEPLPDDEEGLVLSLRIGNAEITFPLQVAQALGLGLAFMQAASPPPQQRQAGVQAAPRDDAPKVPSLPEAEAVLPVEKTIRPAKRHTHRHCEVCGEAICLLVKKQARQMGLEQN